MTAVSATALAGRTTISARALASLLAAVAGDELGVAARDVASDIRDESGMRALAVRSPVRVPALIPLASDADASEHRGDALVDRTAAAQQSIRTRVEQLTGSTVARLEVRVTAVRIEDSPRTDRVDASRPRRTGRVR